MPNVVELKASAPKVDREIQFEVDLGASVDEKVQMFGEEAVNKAADSAIKIDYQDVARRMMIAGESDEKILEALQAYKPGESKPRTSDPLASITKKLDSMSPEEKEAYRQKIKELIG